MVTRIGEFYMVKKCGFTLAEVLITLGIIGVVAALTAPALVGSYQKSKVPPALKKFINTMEVANQHIITENETSRLSSIFKTSDKNVNAQKEYLENLTEFVQGTISTDKMADLDIQPSEYRVASSDGENSGSSQGNPPLDKLSGHTIFNMPSGEDFSILITDLKTLNADKEDANGSFKGRYATVLFDTNGFSNKPNRLGKDIYYFHLDDGGVLVPNGGEQQIRAYGSGDATSSDEPAWKEKQGTDSCNEEEVGSGASCAGSIMDNNWKIIYKY